MLFQAPLLVLASLSALVSAQSTSTAASKTVAAAASATSGATLIVKAITGNGKVYFEPENIKAEIGAKIEFQFYPANHSVVQSSFDKPCVPLGTEKTIYTGFFPAGANDVTVRTNPAETTNYRR